MEDKLNVKDQIKIILEFANSDEQVYLKQTNFELYKYRFESNFSEFNEKFLETLENKKLDIEKRIEIIKKQQESNNG